MSEGGPSPLEKKGDEAVLVPSATNLEAMLRSVSPEVLDSISPEILDKLKGVKAVLVTSERHTRTEFSMSHSGPLPHPSYLAAYNDIIPQGAERIMKQAENQSAHRMDIEKTIILGQGRRESNGQWFAFIIALVGLVCGTYAILCGHPVAGCTICGSPLVGIVTAFLYSKQQGAKERKQKKDQMEKVNPAAGTPPSPPDRNQRRQNRRR